MSMFSLASVPVGFEVRSIDNSFKIIVFFCCIGLIVSFSLVARGVDLSAGLI